MAHSTLTPFLVFVAWLVCGISESYQGSLISLDHATILDPVQQNFLLQWGSNFSHIEMEVTAKTLGWLSVAISPNGGMDGADGMLAWVNDTTGAVTVQDRWLHAPIPYSSRTVNYTLDAQQDWILVSGSQNTTHTTVRVVRKLNTCDPEDRLITTDTVRLIFSMHPNDPLIPFRISRHFYRGSRSLLMLSESFRKDTESVLAQRDHEMDEEEQPLNLLVENVSVPASSRTVYYCSLIKLPTFTEKRHVITVKPVITPGNEAIVHHVLAYLCNDEIDDSFPEKNFDCSYDQPRPLRDQVTSNCTTIVGVFGIGSEAYHYPLEAGFPLTPEMSGKYVFLENHYDNPDARSVIDNSGIGLMTTSKLRRNDAATMMIGYADVGYSMMIPPKVDDFVTYARCSQNCTGAVLPDTGIKVINVLLHTHLLGRRLYLRQIRRNNELAPIAKDETYDFNYQESQRMNPPRVVLPGDALIMECHYNSMDRTNVTFGGWGTPEEMCMAFVTYYPATPILRFCSSQSTLASVLGATGSPFSSNQTFSNQNGTAQLARVLQGNLTMETQYKDYMMSSYEWTPQNVRALQDVYRYAVHPAMCESTSSKPFPHFLMLKPANYTSYEEPSVCRRPRGNANLVPKDDEVKTHFRSKSLTAFSPIVTTTAGLERQQGPTAPTSSARMSSYMETVLACMLVIVSINTVRQYF